MPVTAIVDAAKQVVDLIEANWTAANTRSVTPEFSTGWFAEAKATKVQLTVTNPDDHLRRHFLGSGGAGQFRDGRVLVSSWVPEGVTVLGSTVDSGGAKKLSDLMRTEVDRIVTENQNLMSDFEHLWIRDQTLLVESERRPVIYRWAIGVGYSWLKFHT